METGARVGSVTGGVVSLTVGPGDGTGVEGDPVCKGVVGAKVSAFTVGELVGAPDASAVGSAVGLAVGLTVGLTVGLAVGLAVGEVVGATVGSAAGASVVGGLV